MTDQKNEVELALKSYTRKERELATFEQENEKVLSTYWGLQVIRDKAEANLKDIAKAVKEGAENKYFRVVYSPKWKKWYDLEAVYSAATPDQKKLIDEKCLIQTIDKKKFDELIKSEDLPRELKQKAFREEEMASSVSIKKVTKE